MRVTVRQVPNEHRPAIKFLATLDDRVASDLLQALQKLPPKLDLDQLTLAVVSNVNGLNQVDLQDLLRVLFSLYDLLANTDMSADELAGQIGEAIQEDDDLKTLPSNQVDKLKERLRSFLDGDGTISASYKAQIILSDHKYVFTNSRIFTDMRPVFKTDVTTEPLMIGIVHTLKVGYKGLDGPGEFFVALDPEDLKQINEEINRAIDKEKTIRQMLDRVDLNCFGEGNAK
jgi:hypothetical protein